MRTTTSHNQQEFDKPRFIKSRLGTIGPFYGEEKTMWAQKTFDWAVSLFEKGYDVAVIREVIEHHNPNEDVEAILGPLVYEEQKEIFERLRC